MNLKLENFDCTFNYDNYKFALKQRFGYTKLGNIWSDIIIYDPVDYDIIEVDYCCICNYKSDIIDSAEEPSNFKNETILLLNYLKLLLA